jgi:hypothetical protein
MQPDAITDLHYLPSIHFFTYLTDKKNILVEVQNHYEKQTCRNRCYLLGANQVQRLSIPVIKPAPQQTYAEVRIDYRERWQDVHWRTIYSAYGKAPYFEHYAEEFRRVIYAGEEYLVQFNLKVLTLCLDFLRLPVNISTTTVYISDYGNSLSDMRGHISCIPTQDVDMIGYIQLFGKSFVHNLSIIDLLFCEGPQSIFYLQKSRFEQR